MHPKLLSATSFTKLEDAAISLGISEALDTPLDKVLEELPRKEPWATTTFTALKSQSSAKTLRELLGDRRAESWLFRLGRERASDVLSLIRRYLAMQAIRAGVEDPGVPKVEKPEGAPMWPLTEEALVAWAREHSVEQHLDDPISAAVTDPKHPVRHVAYGAYGRHRIRYVLVPASLAPATDRALAAAELLEDSFTAKEIELLRLSAWSYLTERAEEARIGFEEEKELLARIKTPEEPGARRFFDELRSARIDARSAAIPRSRAMIGDAKLVVTRSAHEDAQLTIQHHEPEPGVRPHSQRLRPSVVTIAIDPFEDLRIRAQCPCTPSAPNACAHALAAIDRLLAVIGDAKLRADEADDRAQLEAVLEIIRRPRWSRALSSIDRVFLRDERKRERADEHRLWWQIVPGLGGLEIQAFLQQRGKRGEFLKPKPLALDRLVKSPEMWTLPQDAKVVELFGASQQAARSFSHVRRALERLAGHPRVFYGDDWEHPLEVKSCKVEIAVDENAEGALVLAPRLEGKELDRDALKQLSGDSQKSDLIVRLDVEARRCALIALDDEQRGLLAVLARHGFVFPKESREELLRRLPALGRKLAITIPPALAQAAAIADSRIFLRMEPDESVLVVEAIVHPIALGPSFTPGEGQVEVLGAIDGNLVSVRRDLEKERTFLAKWFPRLDLAPNEEAPRYTWVLPLDPALALLERSRDLIATPEGAAELAVEWPKGQSWKISRRAGTKDLRVSVADKRDWFGLEGEIEVDGTKVALGLLLEAARKNRAFVQVATGEWVAIAEELRNRLSRAGDVVFESRAAIELAPTAALALEDLLESAGRFDASPRFRALLDDIEASRSFEPELPKSLAAELRDYQLEGYKWLARLARWGAGACLADDMGLGKTLQALAVLIDRRELGPALVVAPTSVCFNWVRETKRFAPDLRPVLYRELGPEKDLSKLGPGDVLVVSYGMVARDVAAFEKVHFGSLIIDEAQAIKNFATHRARAVRRLDAAWRVALTGTPVENHLGELWSIFRAIAPGLLGSWEWFRGHFAAPIERDKDADRRRALARAIRPFILRRTKAEVLKELPPRTEIELEIELSREERRLYDAVRLAALTELEEAASEREEVEASKIPILGADGALASRVANANANASGVAGEGGAAGPASRRFKVLAAITRLRQLACHPALYDEHSTLQSAKLTRFMELVFALRDEGHRALVFSQFTRHLALIRRALDAQRISYAYLDGSTPAPDRERLVDRFQRGDVELFLISLKAGGTGLNLTAADYVIHLDPWWNPAVEDQATDRAHRIGQARPVTVYRLVARGTIEQAMLAMHAEKRELVRDLLEGADAAAKISTDDLIRLIREGAGVASEADAEPDPEPEVELPSAEDPAGPSDAPHVAE